ncbi:hypothetical protein PVK06_017386 [Gossypium arboreum]|uniref:Uncharacterized protein n=3 Tax=Gossypium TaxID=3633 RepID=A0ABR0Q313_GOSAR|nr:hypothetical protein PVK06_049911 [Gossypium arboreum]KAK5833540.1 hypothetical protein PVK06_017386 [Gossypium arboreum]KJB06800.1 hypothetical protein B456_001G164000 [Gossypium raimondii]
MGMKTKSIFQSTWERKLVRNRKQTNLRTQNPKSLIPKLFLIPQRCWKNRISLVIFSSTSIPLEMVELSNSHSSVDVLYLNLSSEGLKEDLAYQTLAMKPGGRML